MTFGDLLQQKKTSIVCRWIEGVLATYPEGACAAFARQKDPFANPIGHSLRVGLPAVFDALLGGPDFQKIREHLHEIVKIRAVQQFSPSQAVGFVFQLKEAIRSELRKATGDPQFAVELADFDTRVDQAALVAFDLLVQCRQRVTELRINELKRTVPWVERRKRSGGGCCDPGPTPIHFE